MDKALVLHPNREQASYERFWCLEELGTYLGGRGSAFRLPKPVTSQQQQQLLQANPKFTTLQQAKLPPQLAAFGAHEIATPHSHPPATHSSCLPPREITCFSPD